jgi:outer membrane protein TolC
MAASHGRRPIWMWRCPCPNDAGKLKAQYARSTADLDDSVAGYNGAVLNAIKQTADAMTQVKSLAAQRGQQDDAVREAQRAFKIAEDRYRSGLSTQIPMLTAESTLLQARQGQAGVTAAAAQQRITLLLTVGGTYDVAAGYSHIAEGYSRHD